MESLSINRAASAVDAALFLCCALLQDHRHQPAFRKRRLIAVLLLFFLPVLDALNSGHNRFRFPVARYQQALRVSLSASSRMAPASNRAVRLGICAAMSLSSPSIMARDPRAISPGQLFRSANGFHLRWRKFVRFHRRQAHDVSAVGHVCDLPFQRSVFHHEADTCCRPAACCQRR